MSNFLHKSKFSPVREASGYAEFIVETTKVSLCLRSSFKNSFLSGMWYAAKIFCASRYVYIIRKTFSEKLRN